MPPAYRQGSSSPRRLRQTGCSPRKIGCCLQGTVSLYPAHRVSFRRAACCALLRRHFVSQARRGLCVFSLVSYHVAVRQRLAGRSEELAPLSLVLVNPPSLSLPPSSLSLPPSPSPHSSFDSCRGGRVAGHTLVPTGHPAVFCAGCQWGMVGATRDNSQSSCKAGKACC